MEQDWVLSQSFVSDGQGVRSAGILKAKATDGKDDGSDISHCFRIVAGNQGGGLVEFGLPSRSFEQIQYQHNHAITAVLASNDDARSTYVTGCKDGIIRVFDSTSHELQKQLTGHAKPVTSLAWVQNKGGDSTFLLSGSWDGTARLWNVASGTVVATLPGHENSVCVTGLPVDDGASATDVRVATGSAGVAQNNQISDHQVRLWTINTATGQARCTGQVANDHDGPIRDISFIPEVAMLMTSSNDGTIKLRGVNDAGCLSTLTFIQQVQHPPMMLSVVPLEGPSSGGIVASAEDGHVAVWDQLEGVEPTVIAHPTCVWNAVSLPNGDFATCCDDGTLRIFTKSTDRIASQEERDAFAEAVQQATRKQQSGPSAEEIAKLPLWENSFQQRGTSEGQVHVFNKGGVAIAAQWSMASQTWIEVGQVMGSSSDQGTIDGVQYDHVLPIEVDQTGGGVAKLQIGYNNGENPFVAAQRFIDAHMLPQHHLNDIANYIQQRVGAQTPTLGSSAAAGGAASGAGFTPGQTIDMAAVPQAPSAPTYTTIPVKSFLSFELPANNPSKTLDKMKAKIIEFGKLSDSHLSTLDSLLSTLAVTNRYHASTVSQQELSVICHMLDSLEPDKAFPALDLARLAACHPSATESKNIDVWNQILTKAVALSKKTEGMEGVPAVALPMLTLRLFANCFRGGPGSLKAVSMRLSDAADCAARFVASSNKNVRLSVATLLYNMSFYAHSSAAAAPMTSLVATSMITTIQQILSAGTYEAEAINRSILAAGTIVLASPEAKAKANELGLPAQIQSAAASLTEPVRTAAGDAQAAMK